jgi:hypothetical protein
MQNILAWITKIFKREIRSLKESDNKEQMNFTGNSFPVMNQISLTDGFIILKILVMD